MKMSANDASAGALPDATPALQWATKSSTVHGRTSTSPTDNSAGTANG